METFIIIVIIVVAILILVSVSQSDRQKKFEENMPDINSMTHAELLGWYKKQSQKSSDISTTVNSQIMSILYGELSVYCNYILGHPSLNEGKNNVCFGLRENELKILYKSLPYNEYKNEIAGIPVKKIINITIEDKSTIEKRITLTRLLLVGIFALAWKKNKKNEMAYIVIDWKEGKFTHNTVFQFEGADSMTKANKTKNYLIRVLK